MEVVASLNIGEIFTDHRRGRNKNGRRNKEGTKGNQANKIEVYLMP